MDKPLGTDRDMDRPGTGAVGYGDLGPQVETKNRGCREQSLVTSCGQQAVEGRRLLWRTLGRVGWRPPPEVSRIHCVSIVGQVEATFCCRPQ